MQEGIVLSLCDRSGNMVRPWAEAGYECICVDINHKFTGEKNIKYIECDIRSYLPPIAKYKIVFGFPPCTNLAVSGARWFKEKGLLGLAEGLELFARCLNICEWAQAPYMIENPVSTISTYYRKPDYTFEPCDFGGYLEPEGDNYSKYTCLWTGNNFTLPPRKKVEDFLGSKMHKLGPSEERTEIRSETPKGFAQAVFEHMSKDNK